MVLQFQPPYSLSPNEPSHEQRSLDTLGHTFKNLGDTAMQWRQQQIQNQRQQQMMEWQKAQNARQGAESRFEFGYDPGAGEQPPQGAYGGGTPGVTAPAPSSSLQQGSFGPQPNPPGTGYSPETGQPMSMAPQSGQMPVDHTAEFMKWKQSQQSPVSGLDMNSIMNMPGAKRQNQAMSIFKEQGAEELRRAQIKELEAKAKMYGQGGPSANKGTWHQDPFTGEFKFYPTVMPGNTPPATPAPGSGGGAPKPSIPFRDRSKMEADSREMDSIVSGAIADITKAIELNKNAYGGKVGGATMKIKSALNMGQDDPKFQNTASVVNSLKSQVSKVLKSTFGAQLSDSEREYLNQVYGAAEGMSQVERDIAMNNVIRMLQEKAQAAQAKAGMGGQGGVGSGGVGQGVQGMIRVRNKQTGQTGQLPAGNFDATKYDQLQ